MKRLSHPHTTNRISFGIYATLIVSILIFPVIFFAARTPQDPRSQAEEPLSTSTPTPTPSDDCDRDTNGTIICPNPQPQGFCPNGVIAPSEQTDNCGCEKQALCLPRQNAVSWETPQARLIADNFYMNIDGTIYSASDVNSVSVHSNPGDNTHTSLELIWQENNREMRLFIYFETLNGMWWSPEIRTYNGNAQGDWIYYRANRFNTAISETFTNPQVTLTADTNSPIPGSIHFTNLRLTAFRHFTAPICNLSTIVPPSGPPPLTVNLHPGATAGVGGGIAGYQWDYDGDGTWDTATAMTHPAHTYTLIGSVRPAYRAQGTNGLWSPTCIYPYTVDVTPPPTVKRVTLLTRFDGISEDQGDVSARVTIAKVGGTPTVTLDSVVFRHTGNGVYRAIIALPTSSSLPAGDTYSIAVKGEKHLQRITPSVTLGADDTYDLTARILRAGDLPVQNGVINNGDLNTMLEIFTRRDTTGNDRRVADVNYDGVVNALDFGLMLRGLSQENDEVLP